MKRIQWLVPVLAAAAALGMAAVALPGKGVWPIAEAHGDTIESSLEVPPAVAKILTRACRDCHSNQTALPWYASLPPASWLVARDIEQAQAAMNLSAWSAGPGRNPQVGAAILAAACADIRSGRMPLPAYRLMHPKSRLSQADRQIFCAWADRSSGELLSSGGPFEP